MLLDPRIVTTTLGEAASEISRKYNLPFGFKIRFQLRGKAIRSDKKIEWRPMSVRPRSDWTIKDFTDFIRTRIGGLQYDDIVLLDFKKSSPRK